MMGSPYALPSGNVQIAFSGGRTSAFMLHQILEANGDLPDRVEVAFQNTGREMPETLDFVSEVGRRWDVPIRWLEFAPRRDMCPGEQALVTKHLGDAYSDLFAEWWRKTDSGFQAVSHNSAARHGEPFLALIMRKKFLPNQQARFCTTEMKVRTAKRYLRALGWDYWTNCIGIRADEAHRSTKPPRDRWTIWRPLVDAGVSKRDVAAFWERQPFDLRLPNVSGNCWLGNCDGCFLKSEANIAAFTRDLPDRAAWWEAMERIAGELTSGTGATWSKRYSRAEMRDQIERQGDMLFATEGLLCQKDDGECFE